MEVSTQPVMAYTPEDNELEQYLLGLVLKWKLAYSTPFDFIQVVIQDIKMAEPTFGRSADIISSKAVQITELLLICMFLVCLPVPKPLPTTHQNSL